MNLDYRLMSEYELLSLSLQESPDSSVVKQIVSKINSIQDILELTMQELEQIEGMDGGVAEQFLAAMMLAKKIYSAPPKQNIAFISPASVAAHYMPQMRERRDGCFLVTTGATAHFPMASHANGAASQSALCHYLNMLHERSEQYGVYVGSICIGAPKDDPWLANKYWEMCQEKGACEFLYGNLNPTIAYQYYVNRGFGLAYPPSFTSEPPAPKNEEERDRLVLALYDTFVCAPILDEVIEAGAGAKSIEFSKNIAAKYGADFNAPYWGAKGE